MGRNSLAIIAPETEGDPFAENIFQIKSYGSEELSDLSVRHLRGTERLFFAVTEGAIHFNKHHRTHQR